MELFDKVLLGEKAALIVMLTVIALINKHNAYITNEPRMFMYDNIISGTLGAIAFWIIATMRNSDKATSIAITTFMLLFMLNVLMELAGFNDTENLTQVESKEVRVLKWPVAIVTVIGLAILGVLAFRQNEPLVGSNLPIEAAIFGGLSGLSALIVGLDHKGSPGTVLGTAGASTAFFAVLHVVLQKGGFYKMVF